MAKKRSKAVDYGVYLAVRALIGVLQAIPAQVAFSFARVLAALVHAVDKRHRMVADENLRHAFPEKDEAWRKALIRRTYDHFLLMVVEMLMLPRKYNAGNIGRYVVHAVPEMFGVTDALYRSGKPAIMVVGHFGNWEVMSYTLGLAGYRGAAIARPLDNPYLDDFLKRFRVRTGQRIIDKKDYAGIQRCMAACEGLGIVGDQDAGARGLFVPFFNRPASTFKSVALLALEHDAPILVFGAARAGKPLHYRLHVPDIIYPADYAHQPDAARAITLRFTQALESLIRMHPEQYFWLHRRWKHQPPVRRSKLRAA